MQHDTDTLMEGLSEYGKIHSSIGLILSWGLGALMILGGIVILFMGVTGTLCTTNYGGTKDCMGPGVAAGIGIAMIVSAVIGIVLSQMWNKAVHKNTKLAAMAGGMDIVADVATLVAGRAPPISSVAWNS